MYVNTEARRLNWRCRRGMLELDIMLTRFVEQRYEQLTPQQLHSFDALLDCADNDLWDLVIEKVQSENQHQQQVLDLLREVMNEREVVS